MKKLLLLFTVLLGLTLSANAEIVFNEDFSSITNGNNTSTGGSNSAWSGNSNITTINNAYQAGGAVRIGAKSKPGSVKTKALDLSAGNYTVSFDVKGWTSVEGDIKVTPSTATSVTKKYTAKMSDNFETISIDFTGGTENTTITIETTAKRAFIDNIVITVEDTGGDVTPTLDAPEFSEENGYVFYPSFDLTISAEAGATIYYTLDGEDPTEESYEYVEPITISETTTVKAYAVAEGYNSSEITTATYIISQWKTPTFSQADGYVFSSPFDLTISAEEGATIYYTLDGTDPTEESYAYVEPITISETTTVKAYAVAEGRKDSSITTATYTYFDPSNIKQYGLVTSADQLVLGVNYLIAYDKYAMGERPSGKNYFNPVAINAPQNGIITILAEAVNPVTLGGESGAWTFKTTLGDSSYLNATGGTNLTENVSPTVDGSLWTVTFEEGYVAMSSKNSNVSDRIIQYNSTSPRFANYATTYKDGKKINLYAELKYVYICDETSKGDVQIISIKDKNGEDITYSALEAGEWSLDLTRSESVVYNKRYGFVPSNGVYTITYQYTKDDVVVTDEREFTPTQDGTISFTDDIITSINGIEIENAPVEYFNLQGVRVANPENGLYIRRQGNKVEKIFLKK